MSDERFGYTFESQIKMTIVPHRDDEVYLIACPEWDSVKGKLSRVGDTHNYFETAGGTLIGGAISIFGTLIFTPVSDDTSNLILIGRVIAAAALLLGIGAFYMGHKYRQLHEERVKDVVGQMDMIERRFDNRPSTQNSPSEKPSGAAKLDLST